MSSNSLELGLTADLEDIVRNVVWDEESINR